MAILTALGIDSTLGLQFILAVLTFFALSTLVFKPYAEALHEREKRTTGGETEAVEFAKQSEEMRLHYQQKAQELNSEVKKVFDSYREEANREYEAIVSKARTESQRVLEQTRSRVSGEIAQASARLKEEVPQVAQVMTNQLLSKKA